MSSKILSDALVSRAVHKAGMWIEALKGESVEQTFARAVALAKQSLRASDRASDRDGPPRVAITCTQIDPRYAASLANATAAEYADELRAHWIGAGDAALEAATRQVQAEREAVSRIADELSALAGALPKARQALLVARAELPEADRSPWPDPRDVTLGNNAREDASSGPALSSDRAASVSGATDNGGQRGDATAGEELNPEWRRTKRVLDGLQQIRQDLLVQRTAEHPAIRELDQQIAASAQALASTPRVAAAPERSSPWRPPTLPDRLLPAPPPVRVDPRLEQRVAELSAQFHAKQAELHAAQETLAAANAREAAVRAAKADLPRFSVERAVPAAMPAASGISLSALVAATAVGILAAVGVGLLLSGLARSGGRLSLAELDRLAGPALGVVPASRGPYSVAPALSVAKQALLLVVGGLTLTACFAAMWWFAVS